MISRQQTSELLVGVGAGMAALGERGHPDHAKLRREFDRIGRNIPQGVAKRRAYYTGLLALGEKVASAVEGYRV